MRKRYSLSTRIRQARAARLVTQQELAVALGVSTRTVQAWESWPGVQPQFRHQRLIQAWLADESEVAA